MVTIMTKQEKIERFRKMNETIEKGQIVCAGSSLMEMFPVDIGSGAKAAFHQYWNQ